jgi:hypothetical protein
LSIVIMFGEEYKLWSSSLCSLIMIRKVEMFCLLRYKSVYPSKVNRPFEGSYRFYLQGRRESQTRNQMVNKVACHLFSRQSVISNSLGLWRLRWYVPLKHRLTVTRLHGVISQKAELFVTTAVRTWNPIYTNLCILSLHYLQLRI